MEPKTVDVAGDGQAASNGQARPSNGHVDNSVTVTAYIPIRTVSELNLREHWTKTNARNRHQQTAVRMVLRPKVLANRVLVAHRGLHVTLTRIAPRALDTDNLASSFKHVQDGVAGVLGIDDRHIAWTYAQRKGRPKQYGVEIRIEARS